MRQNRVRSTLPQLFTQHRNQGSRPEKQGGIFSLDLNKKDQNKFISPAKHGIQTLGIGAKKLTDVLNQTFRSTRYSSSPSKNQKIQSLSFSMTHRQFPMQAAKKTTIQIRGRIPVDKDVVDQYDSFKSSMRKLQNNVNLLSVAVNREKGFQKQIRQIHAQFKQDFQSQLNELDFKFRDIIKDTWQMLSILRRETGMQQKVMKKDLSQINREFVDSVQIIQDIEKQRTALNIAYFSE